MNNADYARRVRVRREAAKLSQREVADLAGVKQPYVAHIEAGKRIPSAETRAAIDRILDIRPAALLLLLADDVAKAVSKAGASDPRVFGSVARGDDAPGSDIDLLVTFPPDTSVIELLALEEELSSLLTVPVDLVPDNGTGPIHDHALAEAAPL